MNENNFPLRPQEVIMPTRENNNGMHAESSSFFLYYYYTAETCLSESATSQNDEAVSEQEVQPTKTKTVYGFLDFTTTVSDTVMVFKPSKTPAGNILFIFTSF